MKNFVAITDESSTHWQNMNEAQALHIQQKEILLTRLNELDALIYDCKVKIKDCDDASNLNTYWNRLRDLKSSKHSTEVLLTMVK